MFLIVEIVTVCAVGEAELFVLGGGCCIFSPTPPPPPLTLPSLQSPFILNKLSLSQIDEQVRFWLSDQIKYI